MKEFKLLRGYTDWWIPVNNIFLEHLLSQRREFRTGGRYVAGVDPAVLGDERMLNHTNIIISCGSQLAEEFQRVLPTLNPCREIPLNL